MKCYLGNKVFAENYANLLPQLDLARVGSTKVIQKMRLAILHNTVNVVGHIFAVAVFQYQIGTLDPRFKKITDTTIGAKKLYKLV